MIKKKTLEFLYCSSGQICYHQIYYGMYFWCPLSFTNVTHLLPDGPLACSLCYICFLFNCLLHRSGSTNICQWSLRKKGNTCMFGLSPLLEAWNIFSINYINEENFYCSCIWSSSFKSDSSLLEDYLFYVCIFIGLLTIIA